jgi:hypothetical protein
MLFAMNVIHVLAGLTMLVYLPFILVFRVYEKQGA